MSAITPNTELRLLKCPIEEDNLNQITFADATAQYNYFNSLSNLTCENFTYQRQDGVIRYPEHIDNIIEYNYVMYQNEAYTNKWFYAFITRMEYVNDHMTSIYIKTDVFQTWQFDLTYKRCYVEREHVNNDGYYHNLIDEGLPYGDYQNSYFSNFTTIGTSHPVMATTVDPHDGTTSVGGGTYGGIYSGSKYYVFNSDGAVNNALRKIAEGGKSAGVVGVFLAPDWVTGYTSATFDSDGIATVPQTSAVTSTNGIALPLRPTALNGYTPKNKKLFNYPYFCYVLSNNAGGSIELKPEDFKDNQTHVGNIDVVGTITPGCSIRAIPKDYKAGTNLAEGEENEYGLTMGKFPICSYPVDMYTNWLTQNSVNITLQTVGTIGAGIAGAVMMAVPGMQVTGGLMIAGSIGSAINTMTDIHKESLVPDSVQGNANAGDVIYASGKLTYTVYCKFLKPQYAGMLDDFFTKFGYKVNSLKVPNITGRSNWNYVKTDGAIIEGDVPQADLQEIKDMFNKGITLWHTTQYYLDYSRTNSIVS